MSLFIAIQSWNILHWLLIITMVAFVILWATGNKYLNDIYERAFRIEQFDQYYEYPGGFFLLHVRNLFVLIILFIIFKIV